MVNVTNDEVEHTRQYLHSPYNISLGLPGPEDGGSMLL
jgi:hypothetical protein